MARHSKWAKVKTFKGGIDARRGKIFAKLSKEIFVAARMGGADPDLNPRLRAVLIKARAVSMPNDNVDRAIKRATGGGETTDYEDLTYEIYGPHGVAILADLSTDNRNRTAAEIRSICAKNGGSIATANSVARLFHRKGHLIISRDAADEDAALSLALDAGAEDFKAEPEGFEIITDPAHFEAVHHALESKGIKAASAEVAPLPEITIPVSGASADEVHAFLELLEDHDDVKSVWSNAEFADV
jgi:YebC/PmpR family DNA-binding regulatory protein